MSSAILPARAVACFVVLLGSAALAEGQRERVKPYRVIFNCDGHAVAKDSGGDLNQWIDNLFGPLAESHVDALFWCDGAGGNTANDIYLFNWFPHSYNNSEATGPYMSGLLKQLGDPDVLRARQRPWNWTSFSLYLAMLARAR